MNTRVNISPGTVNNAPVPVNTDPHLPDLTADATALWAAAQAELLPGTFPAYGSDAWRELPPTDPRRYAAALVAAESWRRQQVRENWLASLDDDAWHREVTRDALDAVRRMRLSARPVRAELDALARPLPPHRLTATPGWPPVAVPGQPGRYLTYEPSGEAE
ncbi:DUF2742 domain-containing protein [Streptomyces sp. O3]